MSQRGEDEDDLECDGFADLDRAIRASCEAFLYKLPDDQSKGGTDPSDDAGELGHADEQVLAEGVAVAVVAEGESAPHPAAHLSSVGSVGHATGTCRPCAHIWKLLGCSKGWSCTFCHSCGMEDFLRKRKDSMAKRRARRAIGPQDGQNSDRQSQIDRAEHGQEERDLGIDALEAEQFGHRFTGSRAGAHGPFAQRMDCRAGAVGTSRTGAILGEPAWVSIPTAPAKGKQRIRPPEVDVRQDGYRKVNGTVAGQSMGTAKPARNFTGSMDEQESADVEAGRVSKGLGRVGGPPAGPVWVSYSPAIAEDRALDASGPVSVLAAPPAACAVPGCGVLAICSKCCNGQRRPGYRRCSSVPAAVEDTMLEPAWVSFLGHEPQEETPSLAPVAVSEPPLPVACSVQATSGARSRKKAEPAFAKHKTRGLFSIGSAGHNEGTCRPCAHSWKPAGCTKGRDCEFCHTCGEEEFQRKRKDNAVRRKAKKVLQRYPEHDGDWEDGELTGGNLPASAAGTGMANNHEPSLRASSRYGS